MGRILRWEQLQLCQSLVNGLERYTRCLDRNYPGSEVSRSVQVQKAVRRDERAKGEEPLVTVNHNLVLEPVGLYIKLLCEDKRGAPI